MLIVMNHTGRLSFRSLPAEEICAATQGGGCNPRNVNIRHCPVSDVLAYLRAHDEIFVG